MTRSAVALTRVARWGARLLALPIRAYRLVLSPWVGMHCRFQPTCSAYALEALERHGPVRGSWLTLRRIGRCRPGCEPGYDPVPERGGRACPTCSAPSAHRSRR
jgi:hypothetical protein